jgi:uncharacterized protein YvpB
MRTIIRRRRIRPRTARVVIGLALVLLAVLVYASAPSMRAVSASAGRIVARMSSAKPPIIARAFLFNVPFHRQEHALSCEVASLQTALAGIGVSVPEWDLWLALPKDQTQKRSTGAGIVWGDPSEGFVGNVDGRMPATGYGVFIDPLSEVANLYASTSRIRVDDTHAIDAALSARHPIIAWMVIGALPPKAYVWKTSNGKSITAPALEHTAVIVGYRGTADNIEGVYVVDPLTSLRYEPWSDFLARTVPFGYVGLEVGRRG